MNENLSFPSDLSLLVRHVPSRRGLSTFECPLSLGFSTAAILPLPRPLSVSKIPREIIAAAYSHPGFSNQVGRRHAVPSRFLFLLSFPFPLINLHFLFFFFSFSVTRRGQSGKIECIDRVVSLYLHAR